MKKGFPIERETRSTRMGAFNESHIYSIRQQKELQPHRSRRSRTGNHGEDTWFLLPGCYYECSASFSNSGKGGWSVMVLNIDDDGTERTEKLHFPPDWLLALLPSSAANEVYPSPEY